MNWIMKFTWLQILPWHIPLANAAFPGMGGASEWQPFCAKACRTVLGNAILPCSEMGHMHGHDMLIAMPDCIAENDAFLTSLAYCLDTKCTGKMTLWQLEKYWTVAATGDPAVPAQWSYQEALANVDGTPEEEWVADEMLTTTMLVPESNWNTWNHFTAVMDYNGVIMFRYALILLVVGFATPIVMTCLSKLPYTSWLFQKFSPYLVWPSTVLSYHNRPLPWLLGNPPTSGQGLYIAAFFLLNIILSCVGYITQYPLFHPWGYDQRGEILAYAGYRTGEFAFALLPLTILFAGRNNILLWITNWSHSTFILLHRWVARLFALHTILHSVFLWAARVQTGTYAADVKLSYWKWGIVGTVLVSVMLVWSLLWMRRFSYEIFLIGHIIMAIFTIVGSWYHLVLRFGLTGNHEYWLYAAIAVWAFDRVLRIVHTISNGARRSKIVEIGPNHVRVDIPGIKLSAKPGAHGYVYFPTLSPLKPWENHPFSVNSTALLTSRQPHHAQSAAEDSSNDEKTQPTGQSELPGLKLTDGITIYVRKSTGMTRLLKQHAGILTLLDGPYHNNSAGSVLNCDRLVLIGGGIGITGLISYFHVHLNVRLAWSVKQTDEAIVRDLKSLTQGLPERKICVGERLNVTTILQQEAQMGYKRVGVVVCGPAGLCDDVRGIVSRLGRHEKTLFELEVSSFGW